MKKLIFISLIFMPIFGVAQDYYWYKGSKQFLQRGTQEYIIYESDMPSIVKYGIVSAGEDFGAGRVSYRTTSYIHPVDTTEFFVTNRFYVRLKSLDDYQILQNLASVYAVEIIGNRVLPHWYTLECTKYCEYDALQLANLFYESNLFKACEPEFINIIRPACTNDRLFHKQQNLSNIFNPEFDINYCQAKTITSGSSDVTIAVFDSGIDKTHPDLNNFHNFSYDTHTLSYPSQIYSNHGTACAGVIGATINNQKGIAGIAPLCPILDISFSVRTPPENMAAGFHIAADQGCSVISCSWYTIENSEFINEAICYALQNGRNGLGCVIVFAAGNFDSTVTYPANSNEGIITVGAISPCGERKDKTRSCDEDNSWGSCFGSSLDIMAPGISVYSTDTSSTILAELSYKTFNGTSLACPHVSAVAGLILSVNPNLTVKQVSDIIESTAQKVGGYDYTSQEGRPNGTWHQEMGYGLVDAYAAVLAAKTKYIQNHTYQSGSVIVENYPEIIAGYTVTDNKPYGNVILEAGSDVTFSATEQVVIKPGFHAKAGSNLHITIEDAIANIAASPQQVAPRTSSAPTDDADSTIEELANNGLETVTSNIIVSTSIYTISGQLLQTISGGQHDVAHLSNGMYILQHRMSDGSMRSEKIVNSR